MISTKCHLPHLLQGIKFSTPKKQDLLEDPVSATRGISSQHITTINAGNYMSRPLELCEPPAKPNAILLTMICQHIIP